MSTCMIKGSNCQQLVHMVLHEIGGSDKLLRGKAGELTNMGFTQEMYLNSISNSPHGIQTVSKNLPLKEEIFPTQAECNMFKESGSSWFIMRRKEVKINYRPNPAAFARKLEEVLGTSLQKFDPTKHNKFFRV